MNRKFQIGCTITQNDDGDFQVGMLRGIFGNDATEVAVKRIHWTIHYTDDKDGEELLRSLSLDETHHENVLRLLHAEDHDYYEYIR